MADPLPSPSSRQRLRRFLLEFGALGLGVHYFVYALALIAFALSIQHSGTLPASSGRLGVWAAAYVATKLTMPLRVLLTVALTPLLRGLIRRLRKPPVAGLPVVVQAARRHE
jgi:hypothetical protein